ncbi:hypothetical protein Ciccas_000925 [Cichlidogyrus casuarinus]|uniref:Uncharacterized protein n=1 Tax=Cichlidogyrus casuarinus TaxID=1844966 RepID=A0ABD2QNS7_9PLAT
MCCFNVAIASFATEEAHSIAWTDGHSTPTSEASVSERMSANRSHHQSPTSTTFNSHPPMAGLGFGFLAQEIYEEFLVCKICLDSYRNPKSLNCLHTFCESCIEQHISGEVTYNKHTDYRDFMCPLCRKRTQLPMGGVKKLPDNFMIIGLTDLMSRQNNRSTPSPSFLLPSSADNGTIDNRAKGFTKSQLDESGDRLGDLPANQNQTPTFGDCEICSQLYAAERGRSTTPMHHLELRGPGQRKIHRACSANLSVASKASARCLDCNKLLCNECVQRHRSIKVTKDHAIFELEKAQNVACVEHPEECVRFYCEACSCCVCVLCTFNRHRDHEVCSFHEAVLKTKSELKSKCSSLSSRLEKSENRLQTVSRVANMVESIELQIKDTAEALILRPFLRSQRCHRRMFVNVSSQGWQYLSSKSQQLVKSVVATTAQTSIETESRTRTVTHAVWGTVTIQQDAEDLLRDLHRRVGRVNMEAIDRRLDLQNQIEKSCQVKSDVERVLSLDQDFDLLSERKGLLERLSGLMQENGNTGLTCGSTGLGISPLFFHCGQANLGTLSDSPNPSTEPESKENLDNSPIAVHSTVKTYCNAAVQSGENASLIKGAKTQRHRAVNTEVSSTEDKDTNTYPRGIGISLVFGDANSNQEETYSQLPDGRIVNANGTEVDLDAFDNLTRARIRRKLRQRVSTDETSGSLHLNPPANRRYSAFPDT